MAKPLVHIIILNWNGIDDTLELLESLFKISYRNYSVIIVDNDSIDDEAERLERIYKDKVHIIKCRENLGFAGGNNIGIKYSLENKVDYVLLLNNDTKVNPDFLEILVNKYESTVKAGILAPRINYYSEPQKIWTEGGYISRLRGSGFAYSDKLETEAGSFDKSVTFVSGCCMLISRDVLYEVGLFDEKYFLYTEDTDLCQRIINKGYKICVAPEAKIFHKVSNSTKNRNTALPLYYTTRNRLFFAKKNFRETYYITITYIFFTMLLKNFTWFVTGNKKNIVAVKQAFKDFFLNRMGKTEHNFYSPSKN
jgi:GT2 family glycosyltransferase